jgi:maltose O-acetyltransferase
MLSSSPEVVVAPTEAPLKQSPARTPASAAEAEPGARVFRDIRNVIRPWLMLCSGAAALLPNFTFPRLRSGLLRMAGCDLAPRVALMGRVKLVGSGAIARRLHLGEGCVIAPGVTFGLDADITLGRNVSLSPGVTLYTATHPIGYGSQRMMPYTTSKPIVVGDGVWIGMNSLIMPGVTLGRGCVVSAGSVVTGDVPANALVSGNPAEKRASLPFGDR